MFPNSNERLLQVAYGANVVVESALITVVDAPDSGARADLQFQPAQSGPEFMTAISLSGRLFKNDMIDRAVAFQLDNIICP
jgi:hypothetical protein